MEGDKISAMNYYNHPDLLLEGMAYLGRRACGKSWDHMEQRIQQRKVLPSPSLFQVLEQLKALTAQLDQVTVEAEKTIQALFGNLEGFPYNTIGSSSPAFFLLYPLLDRFQGDWDAFVQLVESLDREEVAWGIASIFEDELPAHRRLDTQTFTDLVLGLTAPDSTKVALLELARNHQGQGRMALACLRPIVSHLAQRQTQLEQLAAPYLQQCAPLSQLEFFTQLSHLRPAPDTTYTIHPFLFGADTNLTFDEAPGQVRIYGGILRGELMELVSGRTSAQEQVCETYRLLGDSTRFDILCYLRGRTAYVQELSTRFSLSRNTIHHHMNKLSNCGLVQCTIQGNRTFYTLDEEQVQMFLERQAVLFGKH